MPCRHKTILHDVDHDKGSLIQSDTFEAANFPNHKKLKTNFWKISPRTFILARLMRGNWDSIPPGSPFPMD